MNLRLNHYSSITRAKDAPTIAPPGRSRNRVVLAVVLSAAGGSKCILILNGTPRGTNLPARIESAQDYPAEISIKPELVGRQSTAGAPKAPNATH
jgi:hypothetical protein